MSDNIGKLIEDFMQVTYDTGWHSCAIENGRGYLEPRLKADIERRRRARAALDARVRELEAERDRYHGEWVNAVEHHNQMVVMFVNADARAETYRNRALALVRQCAWLRGENFRLMAALYQAQAERDRANERALLAEFRLAQLTAKQ